jgi:Leucine-rich repeat (LRR) protein
LESLPVLRTLDLSKNQISHLKGLETIQTLKFLNMSLNNIRKVNQLKYIENLPLITEVDFCVNPVQSCKYYRLQCLFHMPQLRMLDGVEITSEEKVKAENLHGYDLQDREIIFKSLLPEEKFIDRRILRIEDVAAESDSEGEYASGNDVRPQVGTNDTG